MNNTSQGGQGYISVRLGRITAAISILVVLVLVLAQLYVRWTINQNFTLLGGFELEALTFSTFALVLGLTFAQREGRRE